MRKYFILVMALIVLSFSLSSCEKEQKLGMEVSKEMVSNFIDVDPPEDYALFRENTEVIFFSGDEDKFTKEGYDKNFNSFKIFGHKTRNISNEDTYELAAIVISLDFYNNKRPYEHKLFGGEVTEIDPYDVEEIKSWGEPKKIDGFNVVYNHTEEEIVMDEDTIAYYKEQGIPLKFPAGFTRKEYNYFVTYENVFLLISCYGDVDAPLQPDCENFVIRILNHLEQFKEYLGEPI